MGGFFDNVNLTNQASSAAAGRIDSTSTAGGGAGARGLFNNVFTFGKDNKVNASTDAGAATSFPWWVWALVGLGAVLVLVKLNRKT